MSTLLLQAYDVSAPFLWIVGVLVFLTGAFLYFSFLRKKPKSEDLRSQIVNDSNYNVNHVGVDGHRAEGMTAEEAKRLVKGMKDEGSVPSRDEFFTLRDVMKRK